MPNSNVGDPRSPLARAIYNLGIVECIIFALIFVIDPLCFPSLKPESMQSFVDAFPRLADPREIQKVPDDLPVYIFSGSEDPIGQKLEGIRVLIDRYRSAELTSITHDF